MRRRGCGSGRFWKLVPVNESNLKRVASYIERPLVGLWPRAGMLDIVYDLIAGILGVTPAANDGSRDSTMMLLR